MYISLITSLSYASFTRKGGACVPTAVTEYWYLYGTAEEGMFCLDKGQRDRCSWSASYVSGMYEYYDSSSTAQNRRPSADYYIWHPKGWMAGRLPLYGSQCREKYVSVVGVEEKQTHVHLRSGFLAIPFCV